MFLCQYRGEVVLDAFGLILDGDDSVKILLKSLNFSSLLLLSHLFLRSQTVGSRDKLHLGFEGLEFPTFIVLGAGIATGMFQAIETKCIFILN